MRETLCKVFGRVRLLLLAVVLLLCAIPSVQASRWLSGEVEMVTSIKLQQQSSVVYNFRVEDFHTYFVSSDAFLVHNANCKINPIGAAGKTPLWSHAEPHWLMES